MLATRAQSVYVHLPFCKTKCPYCDFASFAKQDLDRSAYIKALNKEIDYRLALLTQYEKKLKTIFFGGGTPSIHSPEEIASILDKLKEYFEFDEEIEITLEANPGTIDRSKLKEFLAIGINRISIGVQSFDADLLEKLGRGHSLRESYQALEDISSLDFKSWNLDLIYGLPKQSLESWQKTLDEAMQFQPKHISSYALSIEQNTPYGEIYKNSNHPALPVEEQVLAMYRIAHEFYQRAGLLRYEISNWAEEGHEAKHNLCYWLANEYYAFGLSAAGYLSEHRYVNTRDLKAYMDLMERDLTLISDSQYISSKEALEEKLMLQLRLTAGVDLNSDEAKILNGVNLEKYQKQGFLKLSANKLSLSTEGILLSNQIIADLIL